MESCFIFLLFFIVALQQEKKSVGRHLEHVVLILEGITENKGTSKEGFIVWSRDCINACVIEQMSM